MISVSSPLINEVVESYGRFFERLAKIPADKCARDVLNEDKVHEQVQLFCRTFHIRPELLRQKTMLEIGSGFGIFLAVVRRDYGAEAVGIEPASEGFDNNLRIGRRILSEYGLPPDILIDAAGENLPFPDNHFDYIFSSTVLEHTRDPSKVIAEALRVLRSKGMLQFVYPNYGAFFEGHYAIPWIPYMNHSLAKFWVRLWGRDPAFIDTLQFT